MIDELALFQLLFSSQSGFRRLFYLFSPFLVTVEQEVAFPPPASKPDLRLSPYPAPE
ncbi:unknown protein [Microcystis aeruginosa NIES-843]|uniref:Uncharacterized protein n=1 Tax=Microcystis aeruginosa (strain NIES-843 / IAM M-2473) TaxID=449447 RepID=B0JY12_MICAN|nr:unknown protein [Microcystis aeruginosa NIES-843]